VNKMVGERSGRAGDARSASASSKRRDGRRNASCRDATPQPAWSIRAAEKDSATSRAPEGQRGFLPPPSR